MSCILSRCRNLELTEAAFHLMSNEEAGLSLKILDVSYCDEITVAAEFMSGTTEN